MTYLVPYSICIEHVVLNKYNALSIRDTTADALFAELDADGSGEMDAPELRAALGSLGLALSATAMENVMRELDGDGGGTLSVHEVAERVEAFHRQRRAFAARALGGVLGEVNRKKLSVGRLFQVLI